MIDRNRITASFEKYLNLMAVPVSELQAINPGSIIELFTIELNASLLHGSNTLYRFHNGANMNANGEVVWAGNSVFKISY